MEVGGTSPAASGLAAASTALHDAEARAYPLYQAGKFGAVALGGAPITLATTAVTGALKTVASPQHADALHHAGWALDGVVHGLWYKGGLMHDAAKARVPWLVQSRPLPGTVGTVAKGLGAAVHAGRLGLLGVGGISGALRAADAVQGGGSAALVTTKQGRGGVLQAVGSALLMVKHPITALAGAAVFAAAIANDFT